MAKRKVKQLLGCGPQIIVVSPELCQELQVLVKKGKIEWKRRCFQKGDLAGAKLVFAATDDKETQQRAVEEANKKGILVNVVNKPAACSFQVPAMLRRGELLITVATGGASPALASRLRKEIEASYGREYGLLLLLMSMVRKQVLGLSDDTQYHKQLFEKLLDSQLLAAIRATDWELVAEIVDGILPAEIEVAVLVKALQTEENSAMETLLC